MISFCLHCGQLVICFPYWTCSHDCIITIMFMWLSCFPPFTGDYIILIMLNHEFNVINELIQTICSDVYPVSAL